ncbi:MAG: DUF4157 domain-containing protein, partial [Cyanobacteriota bacterium]|nr:DUF4157 domain-containing protein [Cyanobacteriota bacterium]
TPTDAQLNSGIPQLQPSGIARRIAPHRHAQPPAPTDAQLNSGIPQLQPSGIARRIAPHRHAQPHSPQETPLSEEPIVPVKDDENEIREIHPKADTPESQLTSPEEINLKADTSAREETHLSSSEEIQAQLQPEEQQEQPGNGTIQRLCSECEAEPAEKEDSLPIQTQLKIGQPGDKYEQEADAKAAEGMKMEDPAASSEVEEESDDNAIQKQPLAETITPLVQRKETVGQKGNEQGKNSGKIEQKLGQGGGQPLGQETRSFMESRFGADFSGVRVHTDSNAVQMNKDLGAQAFTHGQDVYYGKGKSPGKNELTAHELTHTLQQSGGEIRQRQEIKRKVSESEESETGSKLEPQLSEEWGKSQSSTEEKQSPSTANVETADRALPGQDAQAPSPEAAESDESKQLSQPMETVAQEEQSPQTEQNGAKGQADKETNPVAEVIAASAPPALELPEEAVAKSEEGNRPKEEEPQAVGTGNTATESIPEAQALGQNVAEDQSATLNPEGRGEAASPETVAQKEEANASAEEANAKLEATQASAVQLASAGINFTLPQQEETSNANEGLVIARKADRSDGTPAFLEEQRATASNMASDFLSNAAGKIQTIASFGQTVAPRVLNGAEEAKAAIAAAIEQQRAAVTTQIAQVRAQAQSEAQAALAQIGSQHQAAVAAMEQTTTTARTTVETGYTTALTAVNDRENQQMGRIDELYAGADGAYRAAGTQVGNEAVAKGEQTAKGFESQVKGEDDSLLDGPVTDDKLKARAKAARDVAAQYKQGLIEEANKQADEGQKGKSKDLETVRKAATESRQTLESQQKAALDSLNAAREQALSQAQQAQTSLTESANQTLETTLQSLEQQEAAQLQLLGEYGQRQSLAIERDAQKAIAALQDGVNQAASNLENTLQGFQAEMQGMAAPDPQALSAILAETMGQIDGAIATVQGQLDQGIAGSVQGIAQGNQQTLQALTSMGQSAIEESTAAGQGLTTTLTSLTQGATNTFAQLQQTHTTTVTQSADTAVEGFGKVTDGVKNLFDQIDKNLENGFKDSAKGLEDGLRGALAQMDADIQKYGEEAAKQVQPRWKGILKIVLVVVVIVAVALVIGPAVIGAVGAAAGALGAGAATAGAVGAIVGGAIVGAASGAVIQMGSNLIDGKNLMEGVGKAALVGAIGGALGGAGGVLGNALGNAGKLGAGMTQSVLKFGIDTAFDIAGGIFGDLSVGNPITLEGVLIGAGIGAAVSLSVTGLGNLGRFGRNVQGIQTNSYNKGTQFGDAVGTRFGEAVGIPTGRPTRVDVPPSTMPGEVKVEAPDHTRNTEVETSDRSGVASVEEVPKEVLTSIKEAVVSRVKNRVASQSDKFQLTYTDAELKSVIAKGKELGLSETVIEDLIYTGSRKAKAIDATELLQQMEHWSDVISRRGFPEKFADMPEFQQFSQDLLAGVQQAGIPADDVSIQGSSLRKPSANDVDVAVFVDEGTFDNLLIKRYHQKIALTESATKISLEGKTHAELLQLADDIRANPGKYNAQARTFQNAIANGIISSKSDIIKPLKGVRTKISEKYPNSNLEAISVLVRGGLFDIKPELPVKND